MKEKKQDEEISKINCPHCLGYKKIMQQDRQSQIGKYIVCPSCAGSGNHYIRYCSSCDGAGIKPHSNGNTYKCKDCSGIGFFKLSYSPNPS